MAQLWQALLSSDEAAAQPAAAEPPLPAGQLSPFDNTWSAYQAVTCNDVDFTDDVGAYQRAVAEDREKYAIFGAAAANITPCAFWAHEPAEPPVPVNDDGPQNILIVQNRHDPVTPHSGGVLMREKFQERSRLVSAEGSGHGVYIYGDSPCADEIATTFLVEGTMPEEDVSC